MDTISGQPTTDSEIPTSAAPCSNPLTGSTQFPGGGLTRWNLPTACWRSDRQHAPAAIGVRGFSRAGSGSETVRTFQSRSLFQANGAASWRQLEGSILSAGCSIGVLGIHIVCCAQYGSVFLFYCQLQQKARLIAIAQSTADSGLPESPLWNAHHFLWIAAGAISAHSPNRDRRRNAGRASENEAGAVIPFRHGRRQRRARNARAVFLPAAAGGFRRRAAARSGNSTTPTDKYLRFAKVRMVHADRGQSNETPRSCSSQTTYRRSPRRQHIGSTDRRNTAGVVPAASADRTGRERYDRIITTATSHIAYAGPLAIIAPQATSKTWAM